MIVLLVALVPALAMPMTPASARDSAVTDRYTIALIVRSLLDDGGRMSPVAQSIVDFAQKRVAEINRPQGDEPGGINGVPLELKIIKDVFTVEDAATHEDRLVYQVKEALKDPSLIGVYGLNSAMAGRRVIKAVGRHGVPFITEIADEQQLKGFPNIFSMLTSAGDNVSAYSNFVADNYKSTIFIGGVQDSSNQRFKDALKPIENRVDLISAHWLPGRSHPRYRASIDAAIEEISRRRPELVSISLGANQNGDMLKALAENGINLPVFFLNGRIDRARYAMGGDIYYGDLFELGRDIPDVVSGQMADLLREPGYDDLKLLQPDEAERVIVYQDMLSLLREAGQSAGRALSPADMRGFIASKLLNYRPGKLVFHGKSRDWAFSDSRTRAQITLIRWWLKGADRPVLWKVQYRPNGIGIPVAYFSIDMVRIVKVDSNAKSFNAEFYASVASHQNVGLDRFEFGNAVRSDDDASPLVHYRLIEGSPPNVGSSGTRRLYKISGRFRFEPDLSRYPFDQQPFAISVQAQKSTYPVFVQPPPYALRDKNISIEGWRLLEGESHNYVGFDTDSVTFADRYMSTREVVQFYRFDFTWIAERLSLNYYLRVIVPLVLILIVAYMSVFAPHHRIDSVVAIQVTALLATIALYFSIPKFDSEIATLSDQIFVFTEAVIVLMILSSILRSMMKGDESQKLTRSVMYFQAIAVPLLCYFMLRYVLIVKQNANFEFAGKPLVEIMSILIGA